MFEILFHYLKSRSPLVINEYLKLKEILKVILKYKACLVVKSFTQKECVDYKEIFFSCFFKRLFKDNFTLVAHFDLEFHQMNVKMIFLNDDIDEMICMMQSENLH
jgi:Reverse transcriptase (RNA-dependent DNA polymerase)